MAYHEISWYTPTTLLSLLELLLTVNPATVTMLAVPPYRFEGPRIRIPEVGPQQLPARVISELVEKRAAGVAVTEVGHLIASCWVLV